MKKKKFIEKCPKCHRFGLIVIQRSKELLIQKHLIQLDEHRCIWPNCGFKMNISPTEIDGEKNTAIIVLEIKYYNLMINMLEWCQNNLEFTHEMTIIYNKILNIIKEEHLKKLHENQKKSKEEIKNEINK